jgi:hypothetical protein
MVIINHFQYREINSTILRRAWEISFWKDNQYYKAVYERDGTIDWGEKGYNGEDRKEVERQIHDLMDFHVYS